MGPKKSLIKTDERLCWINDRIDKCRKIALGYFGKSIKVERKSDRSPVTIADRKIEEFLRSEISKTFPSEDIIGEELGPKTAPSRSFWTIDPIDGTRAFSKGLISWGILVGYVKNGAPVLGVADFPAIRVRLCVGEKVRAYEEEKSARNFLKKSSLPVPDMKEATIFHGGSSWWANSPYYEGFTKIANLCFLERAYGDCYGYLWFFRGCADAVIDYGVKIWDLAPLSAIARSTNHMLLNCFGKESFQGPGAILAHPKFAKQIYRIIDQSRSI